MEFSLEFDIIENVPFGNNYHNNPIFYLNIHVSLKINLVRYFKMCRGRKYCPIKCVNLFLKLSNQDFIIFRNHDIQVAFYYFTGAVIVNADLGETKSLEKALEGADIMFLTTHYWEERNKEKEVIKVCCG